LLISLKGMLLNNGLLPIQVTEDFLAQIFKAVDANSSSQLEIDLENQRVTIVETGAQESFEINAYKKSCLINGYDDIDFILAQKQLIEELRKDKLKD
jgi:3-isopropylmalate/(R)-2-methylmalate dehydratase small subunit